MELKTERIVTVEGGLVSLVPEHVLKAKAREMLTENPKTTAIQIAEALGVDTKAKGYAPSPLLKKVFDVTVIEIEHETAAAAAIKKAADAAEAKEA